MSLRVNYVEYVGTVAVVTGLVDLESSRESLYPTLPAPQRPGPSVLTGSL